MLTFIQFNHSVKGALGLYPSNLNVNINILTCFNILLGNPSAVGRPHMFLLLPRSRWPAASAHTVWQRHLRLPGKERPQRTTEHAQEPLWKRYLWSGHGLQNCFGMSLMMIGDDDDGLLSALWSLVSAFGAEWNSCGVVPYVCVYIYIYRLERTVRVRQRSWSWSQGNFKRTTVSYSSTAACASRRSRSTTSISSTWTSRRCSSSCRTGPSKTRKSTAHTWEGTHRHPPPPKHGWAYLLNKGSLSRARAQVWYFWRLGVAAHLHSQRRPKESSRFCHDGMDQTPLPRARWGETRVPKKLPFSVRKK